MRTWRLCTLAAGFTVVMTGPGFPADTVRVFRYDGSLQCGMGQAVPVDDMAKELTAVNITVLSSTPIAVQLRFLQTMREVASERNTTTFFPIPIDLFAPFVGGLKPPAQP